LWVDTVEKGICRNLEATLIQDEEPTRNLNSKIHVAGFVRFKFQFHISFAETFRRGAGPQQPLSIEQVLHDEAKPIHDVDLSHRSGTDPHRAQDKSDSAEWQPILTAPINRDLEVRVADPMGHYALMCPCKLIPEHRWINSWLQTPLSHDPVEWREWTVPLVKY